MIVEIQIKNVYGKENIYPVNETAKDFATLTGNKTLSRGQLSIIQGMGYNIKVVQPEFAL